MQRGGPRIPELLHYCFDASQNLVASRTFRTEVLNTLVKVRCVAVLCCAWVAAHVMDSFAWSGCPHARALLTLCAAPVPLVHLALQLYLSTGQIDYLNLCRCYQFLDNAPAIASVIVELLAFNQEVCPLAFVHMGFGYHLVVVHGLTPPPSWHAVLDPLWCRCRSKSCWRTRSRSTCARTTTRSSWAASSPCSP